MKSVLSFIPKLLQATSERKITWRNDRFPSTLVVDIGGYKISTWNWNDEGDGSPGYSIALNKNDDVLDLITAGDYSPHYKILEELYAAARRNYNNVDHVIDILDEELSKLIASTDSVFD